jgi:hypothetical protein
VLPEGGSRRPAAARGRLLDAIPSEASGWCKTGVVIAAGTASTEIVRIADEQKADLVVIEAPPDLDRPAVLSRPLYPVLVTHDARPLRRPASSRTHNRVHTAL